MPKIPINEYFEESEIIGIEYVVYLKNQPGEKRYSKEELVKLFNDSKEELKKISCFMKEYKNDKNYKKLIVLFSDNYPSKIDGYYRMTEEKSLKYYGFNILYDIDNEVIETFFS